MEASRRRCPSHLSGRLTCSTLVRIISRFLKLSLNSTYFIYLRVVTSGLQHFEGCWFPTRLWLEQTVSQEAFRREAPTAQATSSRCAIPPLWLPSTDASSILYVTGSPKCISAPCRFSRKENKYRKPSCSSSIKLPRCSLMSFRIGLSLQIGL